MRTREVKIQLPQHLADWLENVSAELAMTPSQLVATILTYYYEIWRVGFWQGQSVAVSRPRLRAGSPAEAGEVQ